MDNAEIDHYALLGVEPTADKKAIKRAYYELAAKLHPDKHFRKRLGSFKLRLETVFSRLTLAQETLANADARSEYDAYLESRRHSRRIEALIAEATLEAEQAEAKVEAKVERAAQAGEVTVPEAGPRARTEQPVSRRPVEPSGPPPSVNPQARRDALARRLLGGAARAVTPSVPPPSAPVSGPSITTADAMHALKRRYEERVLVAKAAEARKCVATGEQALAAGDVVRAANSFRIACGLLPGDPELERRAHESQAQADALLAETYSRQAAYEEKANNWSAAARSWLRVCQARPNDAQAHGSAARAFMREGSDLRQAARLAQRMCEIEPTNAGARLILAEVYIAAELTHNARRELDTASKLGAQDRAVDALLKRLGSRT